jgi:hypothetical protein
MYWKEEKIVGIQKKLKMFGYSEEKIFEYNYKFGKPNVDGKRLISIVTYDKGDNLLIGYLLKDSPIAKYTYKFNVNDKISRIVTYWESGEISKEKSFEYNDKGLLVKKAEYEVNHNLNEVETFKYGENGLLLLKESCHYVGEKLFWRIESKHNDKGLLVETTHYGYSHSYPLLSKSERERGIPYSVSADFSQVGKLTFKSVVEYDNKDSLIKELRYCENGKLSGGDVYQYNYNDKGLVLEKTRSSASSGKCSRITKYDGKGLLKEDIYFEFGKMYESRRYIYNYLDLEIDRAFFDGEGRLEYGYRSQYDRNNLLVEKMEYGRLEEPKVTKVYEYK